MLKNLKILSLISIFFLLASCATKSPLQLQEELANFELPKMPEANEAIVYVVRPSIMGTIFRFNVFLDDKQPDSEMGYNRGKQYIYFSVTPGHHKIFSKAENWAETEINPKSGDVVFIRQDVLLGIIMARNELNLIDSSNGKKYVKNLNVGTIKKDKK